LSVVVVFSIAPPKLNMRIALLFVVAFAVLATAEQSSKMLFHLAETTTPGEPVVTDHVSRVSANVTRSVRADDIDIDKIIAIGKAIWEIIKANAPVVNYKTDWAGAVPKGVDWMELEGFKDVNWGPFGWTFKNVYGATTAEFKWKFAWTCKGSYQGHGKFLVNVGAAVEKIYAAWGFTVNVNANVDQTPTNYGTKVDPIAGLNIDVSIEVKTVLQSQTAHCRVNVRGDCSGKKVACE